MKCSVHTSIIYYASCTIDLSLPNGIDHTLEGSESEINDRLDGVSLPEEKSHQKSQVNDRTKSGEDYSSQFFYCDTAGDGSQGVGQYPTNPNKTL